MTTALPPVLHVAAMWGTTIITLRHLERGQSFDEDAFPMPDGIEMSETPIRASSSAWEVDARGAVAGKLRLRGRDEDVTALTKSGLPFAIDKGDYGLLQYGQFGIFFQCGEKQTLEAPERTPEILVALALLSSGAIHMGALGFMRALMTPPPIVKPLELVNPDDLAKRFNLRRAQVVPPSRRDDDARPSDPVARGGGDHEGKPAAEGRHGGTTAHAERAPRNVSDLLHGEAGQEILRTLGSLPSVESALRNGGPQTTSGDGEGLGLRGVGQGDGAAVARVGGGSEIHSDWGVAKGGDYGIGTGSDHAVRATPPRLDVIIDRRDHTTMDPDAINRVVRSHAPALRACYDTELVRDSRLRGGVTLEWTIAPSGSVTSASLVSSTIHNARLEGCVLRQVRSWRFLENDTPTHVAAYPFRFGVGG
jgi:hypothetical protein